MSVIQYAERLSDRQTAEAVQARIDLEIPAGPGIGQQRVRPLVAGPIPDRLVAHGLEEHPWRRCWRPLWARGCCAGGANAPTPPGWSPTFA
ncbi:hypothetical protein [Streptomyces sp. NRRL S-813]|uniref:hypothetical protein n=1 Tax=Streptomyces sp. NRRL S-813 TaxID=1463919 RepID=UPI003B6350CD